ncbi:hypothetical protein AXG93_2294s1080 [Marchantia polymorpha subsp. ruderalis]|uniref:Uncharacterized protein n=1 Tax=Marchantia polymorpha subsp. ruderalis TaxID=1480154 RepID=A0A176WG45_MARPO|nr:hypothetical protein AXG93_2294s1080 [Marchantia polymorpha subsp. ruderalis]
MDAPGAMSDIEVHKESRRKIVAITEENSRSNQRTEGDGVPSVRIRLRPFPGWGETKDWEQQMQREEKAERARTGQDYAKRVGVQRPLAAKMCCDRSQPLAHAMLPLSDNIGQPQRAARA